MAKLNDQTLVKAMGHIAKAFGKKTVMQTIPVALVFTDIEKSTLLWERVPAAMRDGLALHDAILRASMETFRGYEMRTEGDAFKVAFDSPRDALLFCLAVQAALIAAPWPDALIRDPAAAEVLDDDGRRVHRGLRIRMGGHFGLAERTVHPTTKRFDWFGPTVNTTARVAATPAGGQVVVSGDLWNAACSAGPIDAVATDLGEHPLRGVSGPVRLMQVMPRALSLRVFPPLVAATRRSNLVRRDDAFVGRNADLFALDQLLEAARVVTVLGPGGTGKTRLAVEYAVRSSDRFPGGTWFADQAGSTSKDDVAGAVARAMLVPLQGPEAPVEVVGRALGGTATLVVMDSLEQVATPAREAMTAWLAAAPEARFLATSQVPIGVAGERRHELGPLADEEAVRLFVERARGVRPDFEPTDRVAIEAIVARLDRLPLGVELAASRCDVMSPRTIEDRLGERFRLLARSDATGRHATLRGAIDWSWDLLALPERHALAQCAVFRGGFELDDAEAVLDFSEFADAPWTVDVVSALRRRSLVYARDVEGALRFGLYESIREYAGQRLVELGGRDAAMVRHVRHFAAQGLRLAGELWGPEDLACCQHLDRDRENLLAAWERAKTGSPDERASIAVALARLLRRTGPAATITTILAKTCGSEPERIDPSLGARLWCARGEDARIAVVIDDARHALDAAIDLARGREPRWMLGHALRERSMLQVQLGCTDEAVVDMQAAVESHRASGHPDHEAMARVTLGFVLARLGRIDEALVSIEHGMALARKHCGPLARATAAFMHALLLAQYGRLAEARELLADTLPELRRCGERHTEALCLTTLGGIEAVLGRVADAEMHLAEAREMVAPILTPGTEAAIDILDASIVVARSGRDAEVVRVQRERLAPLGRSGPNGGRPILESSIVANFHYGLFERACDGA